MNKRTKKRLVGFAKRLGASLLVISTLYGLVFVLPSYLIDRRNRPLQTKAAARSYLEENLLVLAGLQEAEGSNPEIIVRLDNLRGKLEQNITYIESHKSIFEDHYETIDQILKSERSALSQYDDRVALVRNPLTYSPKDDLNPAVESKELVGRASAAQNALNKIAQNSLLSPSLRLTYRDTADCFSKLKAATEKAQSNKQLRLACIDKYEDLRSQTVAFVVEPFKTDSVQSINDTLRGVIAAI